MPFAEQGRVLVELAGGHRGEPVRLNRPPIGGQKERRPGVDQRDLVLPPDEEPRLPLIGARTGGVRGVDPDAGGFGGGGGGGGGGVLFLLVLLLGRGARG